MSFQYTYDSNGKTVGVFVPLQEWEKITDVLKKSKELPNTRKKRGALQGIAKGLRQVQQIEKGKMKSIPLQQLLDEL